MLSHIQARAVYDRLGARQDRGAFYEAPALAALVDHAQLAEARCVFEFGCGTGSFALTLFNDYLPSDALYVGMDQSTTMVWLAAQRLAPFGQSAAILLSSGAMTIPAADQSFDRVITTYVLDLLSEADICAFVAEARRVLRPNGLLGLVSLTYGNTPFSTLVMWGWQQRYTMQPARLGGCRPIRLVDFLHAEQWQLRHRQVLTTWGLASELVIAAPR